MHNGTLSFRTVIVARKGAQIYRVAEDLVAIANATGEQAECGFNGITLRAKPGFTPKAVVEAWDMELHRRETAPMRQNDGGSA